MNQRTNHPPALAEAEQDHIVEVLQGSGGE